MSRLQWAAATRSWPSIGSQHGTNRYMGTSEVTRGLQIERENGPADSVYKLLALEPLTGPSALWPSSGSPFVCANKCSVSEMMTRLCCLLDAVELDIYEGYLTDRNVR
jgi:hypothetical protein